MLLSASAHLQTAAFFFSLVCPEERCNSLLHNNGNYVPMLLCTSLCHILEEHTLMCTSNCYSQYM